MVTTLPILMLTVLAAFAGVPGERNAAAAHAAAVQVLGQAAPDDEASDLATARELFERNLAAIRNQDREGYLACYRADERLVRAGPEGQELGYAGFAAGLDDVWPDRLASRDLVLTWLAPGLVFGTYRYHAVFDGVASHGVSERLFMETPDGWRIAVTTAHPEPIGTAPPPLALVGGTVLDGAGAIVEDAVVLIRDAHIEAVGPRETTAVPMGYESVDVTGRFLVPGMVDTHVHYSQTGWADGRPDAFDVRDRYPYAEAMSELAQRPDRFHAAFLRAGITSTLDCGGYPWTRDMARATEGDALAPRVVAAGPLLATWVPPALRIPDQSAFVLMTDPESVAEAVASHAAYGSDVIKVWLVLADRSLEELTPLVHAAGKAAAAHDLPLIVHATQLEAAKVAVSAGARLLVHSVDDAPVDQEFLEACLAGGVFYCPTLTVMKGYRRLAGGDLPEELLASLDGVSPWVEERVRATPARAPRPETEQARRRAAEQARTDLMAANLRAMARAGVPVVLGTDAGNPLTLHGPSVVEELQAMQAAGLRPEQVLRAATLDAARAVGLADRGQLAPGALADLLVLDVDPRLDSSLLGQPSWVMRRGVLHRAQDLRAP